MKLILHKHATNNLLGDNTDITLILVSIAAVVIGSGAFYWFVTKTDRARKVISKMNDLMNEYGEQIKEKQPRLYNAITDTIDAMLNAEKVSVRLWLTIVLNMKRLMDEAMKVVKG